MMKRIFGVLVLLGGLGLTALAAVALAFAIPANFTVEGKGLEALVSLAVKYRLQNYFLFIGLGLTVTLSSLVLLLSPRKRRVKVTAEETVNAVCSPDTPETEEADADREDSPAPASAPIPVQAYQTNLLGTAFINPKGRPRQQIIGEARPGDVVACRAVTKRGKGETETVGVFTVKGEQMGIIDAALFRAIRQAYPDHRVGATVERVSGGRGVPYTCSVRLVVFRG
jgi:hypothetical protein